MRRETEVAPVGAVRPSSETEQAISQVWQRMFDVPEVVATDNFFGLGGDSVTAVQMIGEIEARFDLVLPSFLVFEAPTVASLAQRVDRARREGDAEQQREFVFTLASSGRGAPMFLNGFDLILARRDVWQVPCPAFAIANWAAGSVFVNARSLRALATVYLEKIETMQRRGPFRLGGFQLGASIAYEMAQQLDERGEAVEFLFLLDPVLPRSLNALQSERPRPAHPSFEMMFPGERWETLRIAAGRLMDTFAPRSCSCPVLAVFSRDRAETAAWAPLLRRDATLVVLDADHARLFEVPAIVDWMTRLTCALEPTSVTVRES